MEPLGGTEFTCEQLSKTGETKPQCEALAGLFAGALARLRNPGARTRRTFADVLEAMEELMVASRQLRIVDERRPAGGA